MIQLTKNVIAVEVPSDATNFTINSSNKYDMLEYFTDEKQSILLKGIQDCNIMGVTPLSEEQWKEVVLHEVFGNFFDYVNPNSGDYARGYMCQSATESGLSLLESKGLDVNKKYAIIKIEK